MPSELERVPTNRNDRVILTSELERNPPNRNDGLVLMRPPRPHRACGRPMIFRFVLLAAGIMLIAGLSGGLGATIAKMNRSSNLSTPGPTSMPAHVSPTNIVTASATRSSFLSIWSVPTTSTSQSLISAVTLAGPHHTLLRDCPSSNNTIQTVTGGVSTFEFQKACGISYMGTINLNVPVASLNDCIEECDIWNENEHPTNSGSPNQCDALCWRNSLSDEFPGQCFGYSAVGTLQIDYTQTNCDGALWIKQS